MTEGVEVPTVENGIKIQITRDDDGSFVGTVVDFPGCIASGDTLEELREALSEALSLYLSREKMLIVVQLEPFDIDEADLSASPERELIIA
jgi:predicted RNase H-like HicB family nuclease